MSTSCLSEVHRLLTFPRGLVFRSLVFPPGGCCSNSSAGQLATLTTSVARGRRISQLQPALDLNASLENKCRRYIRSHLPLRHPTSCLQPQIAVTEGNHTRPCLPSHRGGSVPGHEGMT